MNQRWPSLYITKPRLKKAGDLIASNNVNMAVSMTIFSFQSWCDLSKIKHYHVQLVELVKIVRIICFRTATGAAVVTIYWNVKLLIDKMWYQDIFLIAIVHYANYYINHFVPPEVHISTLLLEMPFIVIPIRMPVISQTMCSRTFP